MRSIRPAGSPLLILASAALLSPNVVGAQISNPVLDRQHDQAVAVTYGGAPGAMEKAVLLHGQVVHQRMAHDSRRFECLRSHANLLYYYGRLEGARLYMEAAAEQAVAQGQDYGAAMTYLDAAILAKEAGDVRAVRELANRAVDLTSSPKLEPHEKAEIRARIEG